MKSQGFEIRIHELAVEEIETLRPYDQRRILDAIEAVRRKGQTQTTEDIA